MTSLFRACAAAAIVAVMGFPSLSAHATAVSHTTVLFSGNCIDCALAAGIDSYTVTGELVLKGENHFQNEKLNENDFVSFSYSGSNLFSAYQITRADTPSFSAQFNSFFSIEKDLGDGTFLYFAYAPSALGWDPGFVLGLSGENRWSTGIGSYEADYGDRGTLLVVGAGKSVPEPATSLLLGAALVGLRLNRRRQNLAPNASS